MHIANHLSIILPESRFSLVPLVVGSVVVVALWVAIAFQVGLQLSMKKKEGVASSRCLQV